MRTFSASLPRISVAIFTFALFFSAQLQTAQAQQWPTRVVKMVVPFAPGGTTDILGRLMAQKLSEEFGQQFIIENKSGAGGNIAGDMVAKSEPDGYTLFVGSPGPHAINQFIYKKQPFDPANDLAPVVVIARVPNIITVHPDVKANTLKELIELAKAQPGKLSFATPGSGGTGHVAMELLKSMTGMNVMHVPYRGSAPALTDVVGGRVEISSDNLPAVQPFVEAGKLKAIAVTSTERWPELPNIPTVVESGVPGYEASAWFTIAAPAKTPRDIIEKINKSVNKYLADSEIKSRLQKLGCIPAGGSPDDMKKFVADETIKWKKVVDFAGLKADE